MIRRNIEAAGGVTDQDERWLCSHGREGCAQVIDDPRGVSTSVRASLHPDPARSYEQTRFVRAFQIAPGTIKRERTRTCLEHHSRRSAAGAIDVQSSSTDVDQPTRRWPDIDLGTQLHAEDEGRTRRSTHLRRRRRGTAMRSANGTALRSSSIRQDTRPQPGSLIWPSPILRTCTSSSVSDGG